MSAPDFKLVKPCGNEVCKDDHLCTLHGQQLTLVKPCGSTVNFKLNLDPTKVVTVPRCQLQHPTL